MANPESIHLLCHWLYTFFLMAYAAEKNWKKKMVELQENPLILFYRYFYGVSSNG